MLCNASLSGVVDDVRVHALTSLHFFATTLCGVELPEALCDRVQECVEGRQHALFVTDKGKALRKALLEWLPTQGVFVPQSHLSPRKEIFEYFGVTQSEQCDAVAQLFLLPLSLELVWDYAEEGHTRAS